MNVLLKIYKSIKIKKAVYFLIANKVRHFDVMRLKGMLDDEYSSLLINAISEIKLALNGKKGELNEVLSYFYLHEPYHYYLYKEANIDINIIILCFMIKFFNFIDIWNVPLEEIPQSGHDKYKLVPIANDAYLNHEGLILFDKFYYYNPLFIDRIGGKDLPMLLKEFSLLKKKGNKISIRLDETISIRKEKYISKVIEFSEIYQGKVINLDKIVFPLYKGKNETLCVYNPITMKKIQFKISHRQDSEKWIEIEELINLSNEIIMTRYLHSIFKQEENIFTHIDGSLNFYNRDTYVIRQKQTINSHSDSHQKLWLVEGDITITEWGKLVLAYFEDYELIFDAFEGKLVEEVFDEII